MLFLSALTFALAVFLVVEVATSPQRRRYVALRRAASYGAVRRDSRQEVPKFKERVLLPAVDRLARLTLRANPKVSAEAVNARLMAAGLTARISTTQFLAVKAGAAIGGVVIGLLFGVATGPVTGVMFVPLLGVGGFLLPDTWLTHRIRARRE